MEDFLSFVRRYVPGHWKSNATGWTSGNCPMCIKNGESRPDTKSRGGFRFDHDQIGYNCFNCDYSAKWQPGHKISHRFRGLLETLGADPAEIQRFVLRNMGSHDSDVITKHDTFVIDWPTIELPEHSQKLFDIVDATKLPMAITAIETVVNRQLDITDDWMYSTHWKYKNRVIHPLRYKRNIVGYTGRNLLQGNKMKYMTTIPRNFVYGLDQQSSSKKTVIVTEGYFDAILTDGLAIGSNAINDNQADIIENLDKNIIVLPDQNAAGARLAEYAISRGWQVSFPPWEPSVTDVNDAVLKYGRYFTIKSIIDFSETNSTKAKILTKQTCKD